MQVLDNAIEQNTFKNIYLIFGEENYLKSQYEHKMTNAIISEVAKVMNFDILEGKGVEVSKIKDICDTLPFMTEHRLLIVKDSGLFTEGKKSETENLTQYIQHIPSTTIILFFEEKVDKRLKIFKEVKKFGEICEFSLLTENELTKWVLSNIEKNGKKISMEDILYLIINVGGNMEILNNEINKLINYKVEKNITKQDIDSICTKSIESKVFELVDAIGNKKLEKAIQVYKNLIVNKTAPFMILSMIARQFRIILQAKYLNTKRQNIQTIANTLGVRDFAVKKALIQSKNFTNKVLLDAINQCLQIDNRAKTGLIQDELAVEMLIIKYAT